MSLSTNVKAVLKGIKSDSIEVIFDEDMPQGISLKVTVEEKAGPSEDQMLDIIHSRFSVDGDHVIYQEYEGMPRVPNVLKKIGTALSTDNPIAVGGANNKVAVADVAWAAATGSLVRGIGFKNEDLEGEDKYALSNLISPEGDELDSKPKKAKKAKKGKKKAKATA